MSFSRVEGFTADTRVNWPHASLIQRARAALAGGSSPLSTDDAIEVVASSAFPNRHRDLEHVLNDSKAPSRVRMRAAMALGRCAPDIAGRILLSAIEIDDSIVRLGVVRALGMVGSLDALKAIEGVMPSLSGRVRNQAEFARLLIRHRHGQAVAARPDPGDGKPLEPAPDCGFRVRIRPARPDVIERSLTSIAQWRYGIEPDERAVLEYTCDRSTGAILLNRAFADRDALELLRARPAIFGFEARRDRASGQYAIAMLILTTPRGDTIDVSAYLTNGTLGFRGQAEVRGAEAHWSLRAVQRPGAFPFRATGTFAGGVLNIASAESGPRVVQQLRPTPLDVATLR